MSGLDGILLLLAVVYLAVGLRRGFFLTLGSVLGFALGGIAAFYLSPWALEHVPGPGNVVAALFGGLLLLALGQALGLALGVPLRKLVDRTGLGPVERLTGGLLNLLALAFVVVILSFSAAQVGIPAVDRTLEGSRTVQALEGATPRGLREGIAAARAAVLTRSGIPEINQQLFPEQAAPSEGPDSPALDTASRSVVRINGTAERCSQDQSGSGFVVSPGRVVTNAHVVSGVDHPVVEGRDGQAHPGTVVYYDRGVDLAVVSVEDLDAAPLPLGSDEAAGSLTTFMGYPLGGPFAARPATVQGLGTMATSDEEGHRDQPRKIYQLAAHVQQGNSGGPLLDQQGRVVGVVFAKATRGQTGYALSMKELDPVAARAPGLSDPVGSGTCTVE